MSGLFKRSRGHLLVYHNKTLTVLEILGQGARCFQLCLWGHGVQFCGSWSACSAGQGCGWSAAWNRCSQGWPLQLQPHWSSPDGTSVATTVPEWPEAGQCQGQNTLGSLLELMLKSHGEAGCDANNKAIQYQESYALLIESGIAQASGVHSWKFEPSS